MLKKLFKKRNKKTKALVNRAGSFSAASIYDRVLKFWFPSTAKADEDLLHDLPRLRSRSRDLYRNGTVARGSLRNLTTSVIGTGLKLQSNIDREFLQLSDDQADSWENNTERLFRNWAETKEADYERKQNFYQLQRLAYLSRLQSGDCFIIQKLEDRQGSIYKLRLKLIEADICENPNKSFSTDRLRDGIELNEKGQPIKYYFSVGDFGKYKTIDAFGKESGRQNVIHYFEMERPGQSRGIPILSAIIKTEKQRERLSEAELAAAVIQSFLTVFIKSNDPEALDDQLGSDYTSENQDTTDIGRDDLDYKLGPASIWQLENNKSVDLVNPMRPNSGYEPFARAILKEEAVALNIPFEILMKEFNASFSASRAARLEFKKFILIERTDFALSVCQPVYEEFLTEMILAKKIVAPGFLENPEIKAAYSSAKWTGDSMGFLRPVEEITASKMKIENGFSTHQEETTMINGGDFQKNIARLKKENQLKKDAGLVEEKQQGF